MATLGLIVDSQTLWEQLQHLAKLVKPCYEHIRGYILGADVIGADETWWPVMQKKSSKKWWVWAMSTHDAVFYRVDESRGREAALRCLGDFEGIVICDGYSVYQSLAKARDALILAHCWSHARRKFFSARKTYPDECERVLDWIDALFAIEKEAPDPHKLEGDAKSDALALRAKLRDERSRPIIGELQRWTHEQAALPKSDLGKAIKYMANQWQGLVRFLDDPMIPLHNNHMERELRNWVLGRKNHYGSRSRRGTEVAALFYTLIETAQLHGSDPAEYLRRAAVKAVEHPGPDTAMLPNS
jgi:transposase